MDNAKYQNLEQCVEERGVMTISQETLVKVITWQPSTIFHL